MRAVDTNVLVRLLVRDDHAQVAAARSYVAAGAWVSHLVLAEAVWVLSFSYGAQHKQLVALLDVLTYSSTMPNSRFRSPRSFGLQWTLFVIIPN